MKLLICIFLFFFLTFCFKKYFIFTERLKKRDFFNLIGIIFLLFILGILIAASEHIVLFVIILLSLYGLFAKICKDIEKQIQKLMISKKESKKIYQLILLRAIFDFFLMMSPQYDEHDSMFEIMKKACENNDVELLNYILKLGFSPYVKEYYDVPNLFETSLSAYSFDIIRTFIENGASIKYVNIENLERYINRIDRDIIIKYLKEHGAK